MEVVRAESREQFDRARELFEQYAASLDFGLEFQDFEGEMAAFPGDYTAPHGCVLLAVEGDRALGCVGLRRWASGICEMKRLYVAPDARGGGVGRALAEAVVAEARRLGYEKMRLDTVPGMEPALGLYRSLGFAPIAPYRHNPIEGATYMELAL